MRVNAQDVQAAGIEAASVPTLRMEHALHYFRMQFSFDCPKLSHQQPSHKTSDLEKRPKFLVTYHIVLSMGYYQSSSEWDWSAMHDCGLMALSTFMSTSSFHLR